MSFLFTNKAITFLDSALSSVSGTIVLASGEGALFPSPTGGDQFALIIENRLTGAFEILYCTNRTGDQLTVSRGQEGTSAASWAAGDTVSLRATAAVYSEFASHGPDITTAQQDIIQAENDIAQLQIDLAAIQTQILQNIYPIGSLYMSTLPTNPAASMGFGTWAAYALGRALVGVGNNGQSSWSAGQLRGSEQTSIGTNNMPAHSHHVPARGVSIGQAGSHTHSYSITATGNNNTIGTQPLGVTGTTGSQTGAAGNHTHSATLAAFNTNNSGGGQPVNNIQPSVGVYVWVRTA